MRKQHAFSGAATRVAVLVMLGCVPLAAAHGASGTTPLTTQDPASAQPTLPKPMPELTVPAAGQIAPPSAAHRDRKRHTHMARHRSRSRERLGEDARPALATVELTEHLPHPPQPPHVTVPVPAYPLEDFVTAFTAPPPPVVCRPTRRDPFQPPSTGAGARPVLCTADNP